MSTQTPDRIEQIKERYRRMAGKTNSHAWLCGYQEALFDTGFVDINEHLELCSFIKKECIRR